MISVYDIKANGCLSMRRVVWAALGAALIFGTNVGPAQARWERDGDRHRDRGDYHRAPPVVYGAPYGYYPPPVVYGSGFGINLNIR